jgi:NADH-quinone oxidoreductase subunit N
MNAILLTAVWGIVMMLSGAFIKNKSVAKHMAVVGIILALLANCSELVTQEAYHRAKHRLHAYVHYHYARVYFNLFFTQRQ